MARPPPPSLWGSARPEYHLETDIDIRPPPLIWDIAIREQLATVPIEDTNSTVPLKPRHSRLKFTLPHDLFADEGRRHTSFLTSGAMDGR